MKKTALTMMILVLGVIPAFAADSIVINAAWARATILPSRPGAAYITIESASGDQLVEVSTPVAARVMIHAIERGDGIARMTPLASLEIPENQTVTLAPGGMHLMLMGLKGKLIEGTVFPITLRFKNAGKRTVDVLVLGIAADSPRKETQ